jgi:protein-disulfide isomerase
MLISVQSRQVEAQLSRKRTRSLHEEAAFCVAAVRLIGMVAILAMGAAFSVPSAPAQTHTNSNRQRVVDTALPAPVKTYGSKTAPVTIEVFSDYECPACGNFYKTTLRAMIDDYVAAGKVYLVHRDFPLPMHQYSYQAARWANAAGRIGKFADVEGALFDNQAAWSVDGNMQKFISAAVSPRDFARLQKLMAGCPGPAPASVKPAGMTTAQESSQGCLLDTFINQDVALGKQIPVTQTPTFVIFSKGQKISTVPGQISWDILKKFIDSLLAQ